MRHRLIAVPVVLVVLTVFGGCGGGSSKGTGTSEAASTSTSTTVATTTSTAGVTSAATITVKGLDFLPTTVTIKVGGTVTFTNPQAFIHTVTPDVAGSFVGADRATFAKSLASHAATFSKAGTFAFHCEIHGATGGAGMAGSVTVVP
jgi:plastocyanin